MDLETGKLYETLEKARAAGVPESNLIEVTRDLKKYLPTSKYEPHQGKKEIERRLKQLTNK